MYILKSFHLSIPELSSLTNVDIAFVTESAATNRSFLKDLPTDPGVPLPLLVPTNVPSTYTILMFLCVLTNPY